MDLHHTVKNNQRSNSPYYAQNKSIRDIIGFKGDFKDAAEVKQNKKMKLQLIKNNKDPLEILNIKDMLKELYDYEIKENKNGRKNMTLNHSKKRLSPQNNYM